MRRGGYKKRMDAAKPLCLVVKSFQANSKIKQHIKMATIKMSGYEQAKETIGKWRVTLLFDKNLGK